MWKSRSLQFYLQIDSLKICIELLGALREEGALYPLKKALESLLNKMTIKRLGLRDRKCLIEQQKDHPLKAALLTLCLHQLQY